MLRALDIERIPFAFRKDSELVNPYAPGAEIDLSVDHSHLRPLESVLQLHGFHRLQAAGHGDHRFYVAFDRGSWLKIDLKVATRSIALPVARRRWPAAGHLLTALAQRRPLSLRRAGPVIALLGPDGAGKGTVIDALNARIPIALTVVYLGERRKRPRNSHARLEQDSLPLPGRVRVGTFRECAFVLYRALRFWRILLRTYLAAWRGNIVLCDRHPIEALAIRPRTTRVADALERFVFGRLMPWPDALLILDAPGEVLHARKGENSVEILEQQRQKYRETFAAKSARVISTTVGIEATIIQSSAAVWNALAERRRW